MVMTTKQTAVAFLLMLTFSVGVGIAVAQQAQSGSRTYKWVDDKGVIHYSDKAPLEAVNREQTVLDKQARQVRRIEATLPEDQRKISEADAEQQRLERVQKDIAERKDRALVLSYLKEEDIDLARDRALSALNARIEATKVVLTQHQARHKSLLERKEAGGVLPEGELEKLESDIANRNAVIDRDLREKETIYVRYERDKQRWRELKGAEKARLEAEKQANKKQ
ncbi:MAG: DUF4124 domain-containing protein [Burkholderiales bacterium]|nr:DUF4124 domain-containing protein [Burkholderiales bacterium]